MRMSFTDMKKTGEDRVWVEVGMQVGINFYFYHDMRFLLDIPVELRLNRRSIQKAIIFHLTSNKSSDNEYTCIYNAIKIIKYLGVNITKGVQVETTKYY